MRSMMLLVGMAVIISGCRSLPQPPEIDINMHWQDEALCSHSKDGSECPSTPMDQTQKWIMFSPTAWEAQQNYIDALIRYAKSLSRNSAKTQAIGVELNNKSDAIVQDLKQFKRHMKMVHTSLLDRCI